MWIHCTILKKTSCSVYMYLPTYSEQIQHCPPNDWIILLIHWSVPTHSLTFYPSYETNLQKCEDRCCPNFPELSLLFCSPCTNLHKMHSTCLLSVQNPTCTSKPAFYFLHMHIFSYKWDEIWTWYWKYTLWGEGDFDFLLELITASLATIMEKNVFGLQNKFWKSCLK